MNGWDIMPVILLVLFGVALSIGMGAVVLVLKRGRGRLQEDNPRQNFPSRNPVERHCVFRRPACWLAIKCHHPLAVQRALELHNPKPCSWRQGLAGEEKLFVSPPVKGWILVVGSGLPEPGEDVDVCFRFLLNLSRKLGQVQFFSVSRVLQHHAWAKVDGGRVVRAYAWAGRTLWIQGAETSAEKELGLRCLDYTDSIPMGIGMFPSDALGSNVDKVPLLAARWSLDPASIDERYIERERGIAGEPARRF